VLILNLSLETPFSAKDVRTRVIDALSQHCLPGSTTQETVRSDAVSAAPGGAHSQRSRERAADYARLTRLCEDWYLHDREGYPLSDRDLRHSRHSREIGFSPPVRRFKVTLPQEHTILANSWSHVVEVEVKPQHGPAEVRAAVVDQISNLPGGADLLPLLFDWTLFSSDGRPLREHVFALRSNRLIFSPPRPEDPETTLHSKALRIMLSALSDTVLPVTERNVWLTDDEVADTLLSALALHRSAGRTMVHSGASNTSLLTAQQQNGAQQQHNPYAVRATPTHVCLAVCTQLLSCYGSLRCCFPDPNTDEVYESLRFVKNELLAFACRVQHPLGLHQLALLSAPVGAQGHQQDNHRQQQVQEGEESWDLLFLKRAFLSAPSFVSPPTCTQVLHTSVLEPTIGQLVQWRFEDFMYCGLSQTQARHALQSIARQTHVVSRSRWRPLDPISRFPAFAFNTGAEISTTCAECDTLRDIVLLPSFKEHFTQEIDSEILKLPIQFAWLSLFCLQASIWIREPFLKMFFLEYFKREKNVVFNVAGVEAWIRGLAGQQGVSPDLDRALRHFRRRALAAGAITTDGVLHLTLILNHIMWHTFRACWKHTPTDDDGSDPHQEAARPAGSQATHERDSPPTKHSLQKVEVTHLLHQLTSALHRVQIHLKKHFLAHVTELYSEWFTGFICRDLPPITVETIMSAPVALSSLASVLADYDVVSGFQNLSHDSSKLIADRLESILEAHWNDGILDLVCKCVSDVFSDVGIHRLAGIYGFSENDFVELGFSREIANRFESALRSASLCRPGHTLEMLLRNSVIERQHAGEPATLLFPVGLESENEHFQSFLRHPCAAFRTCTEYDFANLGLSLSVAKDLIRQLSWLAPPPARFNYESYCSYVAHRVMDPRLSSHLTDNVLRRIVDAHQHTWDLQDLEVTPIPAEAVLPRSAYTSFWTTPFVGPVLTDFVNLILPDEIPLKHALELLQLCDHSLRYTDHPAMGALVLGDLRGLTERELTESCRFAETSAENHRVISALLRVIDNDHVMDREVLQPHWSLEDEIVMLLSVIPRRILTDTDQAQLDEFCKTEGISSLRAIWNWPHEWLRDLLQRAQLSSSWRLVFIRKWISYLMMFTFPLSIGAEGTSVFALSWGLVFQALQLQKTTNTRPLQIDPCHLHIVREFFRVIAVPERVDSLQRQQWLQEYGVIPLSLFFFLSPSVPLALKMWALTRMIPSFPFQVKNYQTLGAGLNGSVLSSPRDPTSVVKVYSQTILASRSHLIVEPLLLHLMLPHPNIITLSGFNPPLFDKSNIKSSFQMRLPRYDCSLESFIHEGYLVQWWEKSLIPEVKRQIAIQLVRGVKHMHNHQLIHNDLTSSNILLRLPSHPMSHFLELDVQYNASLQLVKWIKLNKDAHNPAQLLARLQEYVNENRATQGRAHVDQGLDPRLLSCVHNSADVASALQHLRAFQQQLLRSDVIHSIDVVISDFGTIRHAAVPPIKNQFEFTRRNPPELQLCTNAIPLTDAATDMWTLGETLFELWANISLEQHCPSLLYNKFIKEHRLSIKHPDIMRVFVWPKHQNSKLRGLLHRCFETRCSARPTSSEVLASLVQDHPQEHKVTHPYAFHMYTKTKRK